MSITTHNIGKRYAVTEMDILQILLQEPTYRGYCDVQSDKPFLADLYDYSNIAQIQYEDGRLIACLLKANKVLILWRSHYPVPQALITAIMRAIVIPNLKHQKILAGAAK